MMYVIVRKTDYQTARVFGPWPEEATACAILGAVRVILGDRGLVTPSESVLVFTPAGYGPSVTFTVVPLEDLNDDVCEGL